ncbi:MAG: FHA domain-containing protein [Planctomycetes bacterium]|nr:FHA domain-containing protein [Planctomycetota bacterium]
MSNGARITVEQNGAAIGTSEHELVVGTRTGCDVVLDDPVAADRHCRIAWDGAFTVRDLGSVTGTWIDGKRALAATELTTGSEIVLGVTRLVVRIDGKGNAARLVLDLQRHAFWWQKPGKGVFDNDPDAMVRAEVDFGRFPALRLANRVAAVAALVLLLGAILLAAVWQPLADAGPLLPAHALVQQSAARDDDPHAAARIAAEQGCNACHVPGHGPTADKCMQCHGDLAAEATWRHPWLGDGKLASLPGVEVDEAFCTTCHRDHQGDDWLQPVGRARIGDCAGCHAVAGAAVDRAALLAKVPPPRAGTRQRPFATHTFPHDAHLGAGMPCTICHGLDADVRAARARGAPDDPDRRDFAAVPFATCASCHVPDAPPLANVAEADRVRWRAKDHRWPVTWHGTDDGGRGCRQCHAGHERDGATAFGPELRTLERPLASVDQHAAERARYVAGRRLHEAEFAAHAGGRGCGECHLRGAIVPGAPRPARPFRHALHLAMAALRPAPGAAGAVSTDDRGGCLSCHGDRKQALALRPAGEGGYAWPTDAAAQAACRTCHADGDREVVLQPTPVAFAADRRRVAADFPHAAHVGSAAFGAAGSALADGCFACHTFAAPTGGDDLQAVPVVKAGVADCTQCHGGHDHVGGGACRQCHPSVPGRSNSFLVSARLPAGAMVAGRVVPAAPTRSWPSANGFSHLSPGHSGDDLAGRPLTCAHCHDERATAAAKTIDAVPVPDESLPTCRECHLQRQFHWR